MFKSLFLIFYRYCEVLVYPRGHFGFFQALSASITSIYIAVLKNGLENAKEIKLLLGKVRSRNENLSSVIDCGTRRK